MKQADRYWKGSGKPAITVLSLFAADDASGFPLAQCRVKGMPNRDLDHSNSRAQAYHLAFESKGEGAMIYPTSRWLFVSFLVVASLALSSIKSTLEPPKQFTVPLIMQADPLSEHLRNGAYSLPEIGDLPR